MHYHILYFAQLAQESGQNGESVQGDYATLADLYADLHNRYGFTLAQNQLRVARNQRFADWQDAPQDGDEIAFIPPVSGG